MSKYLKGTEISDITEIQRYDETMRNGTLFGRITNGIVQLRCALRARDNFVFPQKIRATAQH